MRILETKQITCKEVDQNNVYIITAARYACNKILSVVTLSKIISKQSMTNKLPSLKRKIHCVNFDHNQILHLSTLN